MSKNLTYIYTAKVGEMVDEVVHRHYGSHVPLQLVLNANPGLSKLGPTMPTGYELTLPPEPVATTEYVTLWS